MPVYSRAATNTLADLNRWIALGLIVFAVLFQVYSPQLVPVLSFLDLPLLVAIYLSMLKRSEVTGLFIGTGTGILQDAFSSHPIGIYGITKGIVCYFVTTISLKIDVDSPVTRFLLVSFFWVVHHLFYIIVAGALLGLVQPGQWSLDLKRALIHGIIGVTFYRVLDILRTVET